MALRPVLRWGLVVPKCKPFGISCSDRLRAQLRAWASGSLEPIPTAKIRIRLICGAQRQRAGMTRLTRLREQSAERGFVSISLVAPLLRAFALESSMLRSAPRSIRNVLRSGLFNANVAVIDGDFLVEAVTPEMFSVIYQ